MLGSRNGFAVGGWKNPYITDGLIAMWDGEWNAGPGVHDPNTTIWKDLSNNGYDAYARTTKGWSWAGNAYVGNSDGAGFVAPVALISALASLINSDEYSFSLEVVFYVDSPFARRTIFGQYLSTVSPVGTNFEIGVSQGHVRAYYSNVPNMQGYSVYSVPGAGQCSFIKDGITFSILKQGISIASTTSYISGLMRINATNPFVLGGENDRSTMSIRGKINNLRIYNRALTVAEVAANYAIDKARFNLP